MKSHYETVHEQTFKQSLIILSYTLDTHTKSSSLSHKKNNRSMNSVKLRNQFQAGTRTCEPAQSANTVLKISVEIEL